MRLKTCHKDKSGYNFLKLFLHPISDTCDNEQPFNTKYPVVTSGKTCLCSTMALQTFETHRE